MARFVFLLSLILGCGAHLRGEPAWVNGQAARMVIGQPSFTRQAPISSRETIGGAAGVAVAGNRLFIADGNQMGSVPVNNRVLIYENLSSFIPELDDELPQSNDDFCPVCVGLPDVVLGQQDFETFTPGLSSGIQNPTAVASDGNVLAVADTNNNRVLIWNSIPAMNGTAPNVVVGQPDFETNTPGTTREKMRGPLGVWIDNGRLFVADTFNGRVLIYNSIPASNGAPADVVLGQPGFDTRPEPDLTQSNIQPSATGMLDPVSVTVNNGRLFVSDLGFNRVLIFLTVPTQNTFPADIVLGQPDFESSANNNSTELCDPLPEEETDEEDQDGDGEDDGPQFPRRCEATMSFPRFALSDGTKLYVADGGNDRVLVFNEIPMTNGARADVVLGQRDFQTVEESDGAGTLRAPSSLAHDGVNLYVADPFSRRILVFTPAEDMISQDGIVNGASFSIHSHGTILWEGTHEAGQENTVTIAGKEYKYTSEEGDTALEMRNAFVEMINNDPEGAVWARPIFGTGRYAVGRVKFGGSTTPGDVVTMQIADQAYEITVAPENQVTDMVDIFNFFIRRRPDPNVYPERDPADADTILLTARQVGPEGNAIPYSVSVSEGATLTAEPAGSALEGGSIPYGLRLVAREAGFVGNFITIDADTTGDPITGGTRSGPNLTSGSDAREVPAGTIASIFGADLADGFLEAHEFQNGRLPTELAGARVYCNGMLTPLFSVSPEQINFQVPYESAGTSVSCYVRRRHEDGRITVSAPRAARVSRASPGLFAFPGPEPRRAIMVHGSDRARGTVAVSISGGNIGGVLAAGTVATISVNGREYQYTTVENDTLNSVRDNLVAAINEGDGDPEVIAEPGEEGFFSARADVTLAGTIQAGDRVNIFVRDRVYTVVVQEDDTIASVRNKLVFEINSGLGDPEVTARRLESFGEEQTLQVVARVLGTAGNEIPFEVSVNEGAMITATTNAEEGLLQGGQTPPVVTLIARAPGREGNEIFYSANSSNTAQLTASARSVTLCCGNDFFSLVDDSNPAVPGETIVVFGSGLGLTAPLPLAEGVRSGEPTPTDPLFQVPAVAEDFVSSLAAGRTATVEFVGLMPGTVGVYQINLRLNNDMPDNPDTPLHIAQVLFFSNTVTFPVKNLRPRRDLN